MINSYQLPMKNHHPPPAPRVAAALSTMVQCKWPSSPRSRRRNSGLSKMVLTILPLVPHSSVRFLGIIHWIIHWPCCVAGWFPTIIPSTVWVSCSTIPNRDPGWNTRGDLVPPHFVSTDLGPWPGLLQIENPPSKSNNYKMKNQGGKAST